MWIQTIRMKKTEYWNEICDWKLYYADHEKGEKRNNERNKTIKSENIRTIEEIILKVPANIQSDTIKGKWKKKLEKFITKEQETLSKPKSAREIWSKE